VLETSRLVGGRSKLVMCTPGQEMSTPEKAKSKQGTVKNTLVMDSSILEMVMSTQVMGNR
jgi:hypothetical protein